MLLCNIYFKEVQKEVLGQWSEQGILAPRTESLSVYQWSFLEEKNKQDGWANAFANIPRKFLGMSWKFWKNWRSLQVWIHKSVQQGQKGDH